MFIYFIDKILNTEDKAILETSIINEINKQEQKLKVIYIHSKKFNITQFVSTAVRCCRKLVSERLMILPVDFQRQAIQLNIAKNNKQTYQVFEATTAKVLDVWRYLFCDEHNSDERNNQELSDLADIYRKSLKASGLLDHFNISDILKTDLESQGKIYEKLHDLILVIEDVEKFSAIDMRLLKVLCSNFESKKVVTLNANRSLDISGIGELLDEDDVIGTPPVSFEITEMKTDDLFQSLYEDSSIFKPKEMERNRRRIEHIFVCHIRLLINTKDEFALAVILNLPGRDITPKIFSEIKNAAAAKNMPIYQAIMSTVMRQRLAGKSYQPNKGCPIIRHIKPLSNFVDFMMKLQDLIEEESDSINCALKILSKIKTVCSSLVKAHQLEHAYSVLHEDLQSIMESDWDSYWSRSEEQNSSCALQTLKTNSGYNAALKALQHLCDAEAGKNTDFFINNYDFNSNCPQNTPISHLGSPQFELPSLVHLYKSPSSPAVEQDDKVGEASSLLERIEKVSTSGNKTPNFDRPKRFKSSLDWVEVGSSPINKSPATPGIFSPITGPTLKAVGYHSPVKKSVLDWKETLEEIDQNIEARSADETVPINRRKRALITDISNLPVDSTVKKPIAEPSKPVQEPKAKRKKGVKEVKQIKGQQSLKKFFS